MTFQKYSKAAAGITYLSEFLHSFSSACHPTQLVSLWDGLRLRDWPLLSCVLGTTFQQYFFLAAAIAWILPLHQGNTPEDIKTKLSFNGIFLSCCYVIWKQAFPNNHRAAFHIQNDYLYHEKKGIFHLLLLFLLQKHLKIPIFLSSTFFHVANVIWKSSNTHCRPF